MTRKYDVKKAALTRKRNAKKKAQVAKLAMEKMLREQKEREHLVQKAKYVTEKEKIRVYLDKINNETRNKHE